MTAQSTYARDLAPPLRLIDLAIKLVTPDRAVAAAGVCVAASVVLALAAATGHFTTADGRAIAATLVVPAPLDVSPLHRFAPFGRAAALSDGDASGELRGIMLARPRSTSLAIIEAAGRTRSFAMGDTLPGGAILDAVEIDHVIVRADGVLRWLMLGHGAGRGGTGGDGPPTTLGAEPVQDVGNPPPPGELDPHSLLGSLGAAATTEGYRVAEVPSEAMRRGGLLVGDIVEKVDGAPVGDPDHDRAAYDAAVTAGQVRIDVVRAGHRLALALPLP